MLPESHGTHFPISAPTFRTWKPDKLSVTYGEIWKMTTAAVERCIEDAGEDAAALVQRSLITPQRCRQRDREAVVAALDRSPTRLPCD